MSAQVIFIDRRIKAKRKREARALLRGHPPLDGKPGKLTPKEREMLRLRPRVRALSAGFSELKKRGRPGPSPPALN